MFIIICCLIPYRLGDVHGSPISPASAPLNLHRQRARRRQPSAKRKTCRSKRENSVFVGLLQHFHSNGRFSQLPASL
ncbi:uncharacterized protein B0J16DRAFT_340331 [Fusarium flagelliforme]|uniref:uncharacterized protein n=1 Tax=Fusarium flagelliforme TaxID=2675880 RepID=UPI001E8E39AC|nr:uncharacterized protein B0J16DRAFT_340331 [Fusarium flagelliforme]KAH7184693.1 hypothetical protein B0J16DRAFT_340331 [Fusarium flagelliforme]